MNTLNTLRRKIFLVWRGKRHQRFIRGLSPANHETMLDVGGYPTYWINYPMAVVRIHCLNLHRYERSPEEFPDHRIDTLIGTGCALEIPDGTYDIGFSNSVIEHVGDFKAQEQFAREIRRVSRRLWVQTPAYECPIEPHFLAFFIHWLPASWRKRPARNFTLWGWLERPNEADVEELVDYTQLLTRRQMVQLFPDCTIITERLLGILPKSYIAVRK